MLDTIQLVAGIGLWPISLLLLLLVLLQGGAGDVSSSFGGGGQLDSTLGVGASRKMSKITGLLVALFMGAVIILAVPGDQTLGERFGGDVEEGATMTPAPDDEMAPAVEPTQPPAPVPAAGTEEETPDTVTGSQPATDDSAEAADDPAEETADEAEPATDPADAADTESDAPAAGLKIED